MRVRWHHIPTGIAFLAIIIYCIAVYGITFVASGGVAVLHWMGWW